MLHRNFEVKGNADRLLIYLTLYIQSCLQTLEKVPNARDAERQLQALAWQSFKVPGEGDFPLNAFFPSPASAGEAGECLVLFGQKNFEGHLKINAAAQSDFEWVFFIIFSLCFQWCCMCYFFFEVDLVLNFKSLSFR